MAVIASGWIDNNVGSPFWTLDDEGLLSLGGGMVDWPGGENRLVGNQVEWVPFSPWHDYRYLIKEIELTAPIAGGQSLKNLFYSLNQCTKISGLSFLDTQGVVDMSGMFWNMWVVEELDVSAFETGNVTDMSWMFANLWNIETLAVTALGLPSTVWDTQNVTTMKAMFLNCKKLNGIDVFGWALDSVTDTSHMFYCNYALTALDVANWNVEKIEDMGFMFYNCTGLAFLDVSNWDTAALKTSAWMFVGVDPQVLDTSLWETSQLVCDGNMYEVIVDNLEIPECGFEISTNQKN